MPRSSQPQTLGHEITISGRGLHGNRPCSVRLVPVDAPTGLRFVHLPTGIEIPVKADLAGDLVLSTTLVKDGVRLQTIEHLLSALMGLEIEHLRIEVDAEELPILDGSAAPWVEALLQAGTRTLDGRRRFMKILRPVEVRNGNRWMRVSPYDGLRLRYAIDFPVPALGRQSRELSLTPEKYRRELGAARTFCLAQEIEVMRARGLALGGSLDNAVVFGSEGPLNESLRFEDEAVRHKMLDLVGDLALLGAPLLGLVEAHAAGHAMHVALAQAILADPGCWEWTEEAAPANVRFFFQPSEAVALPA
ncbi:MAG TPA: UDP-3-O-acyl-N-acetylglucosamine deacetylase [Holophagaceae bacterium]